MKTHGVEINPSTARVAPSFGGFGVFCGNTPINWYSNREMADAVAQRLLQLADKRGDISLQQIEADAQDLIRRAKATAAKAGVS